MTSPAENSLPSIPMTQQPRAAGTPPPVSTKKTQSVAESAITAATHLHTSSSGDLPCRAQSLKASDDSSPRQPEDHETKEPCVDTDPNLTTRVERDLSPLKPLTEKEKTTLTSNLAAIKQESSCCFTEYFPNKVLPGHDDYGYYRLRILRFISLIKNTIALAERDSDKNSHVKVLKDYLKKFQDYAKDIKVMQSLPRLPLIKAHCNTHEESPVINRSYEEGDINIIEGVYNNLKLFCECAAERDLNDYVSESFQITYSRNSLVGLTKRRVDVANRYLTDLKSIMVKIKEKLPTWKKIPDFQILDVMEVSKGGVSSLWGGTKDVYLTMNFAQANSLVQELEEYIIKLELHLTTKQHLAKPNHLLINRLNFQ